MNCDQVFDILTRGPFPSGAASDASVQRHLSACAECRQLAEALRPALDLIHESVPPEESWGLPGYWEDVPPGERPVTVKQRPQLAVRRVRLPAEAKTRRATRSERARLTLIAALAGGIAAIAILGVQQAVDYPPGSGQTITAQSTPLMLAWPPENCDLKSHGITTVANLRQELQTCQECHQSGHWRMPVATSAIAMGCFDCHEFKGRD